MTIYSHSRLGSFESCPKKFYFSYIEKPRIEYREGVEAFMGKRVHETLEKLYSDLRVTKLNSLKDLLSFYEKEWKRNWTDSIVIVKKGLKQKHYFDLGKKCIEQYYARHKPFDADKTIACEKRVVFSLDKEGKYKMQGYIDRLTEEAPGHYVIHDYKTNGSLPMQDYFDQDRQLALYSIAVYNDFKDCADVNLCWHYLAFDKDLFSKRTENQLEGLKKEMIELIQTIEKAEEKGEFPTKESRLCDWCSYQELCPAKKHGAKVEKLPVKKFKKDEGVKLVNNYVKLSGKLKETEIELDELKENVFAYAEQFGLEKIIGKKAALKISKTFGYSFAGLGKEEKEELMEILKKEKLLKKFLTFDTRALGNAVVKEELGKRIIKEVKGFGEEKETKGVRLVKK